ncbi:MAG: HD domain-containing protein [Lachnospiraceae bacterium]|nr:HD domain-containing protein [Lachnospiraceae bacterium]
MKRKRLSDDFKAHIKKLISDPKIRKMDRYTQHGSVSTFRHCYRVAKKSYDMSRWLNLKVNTGEMLKGAMLHDYFLYDWHNRGDKLHGYHHPHVALKNALKDFSLTNKEQNIIKSHMWPLTITHIPRSREAILVCIADKICSIEETLKK